ncbi:MAG: DNA polymerase III subunit delta [Endomicrobiales bacterium]|jgi:DNA polymerase-3 subunit delta
MTVLKSTELFTHLAAKKLKPVYLLTGEETYLQQEALEIIRSIVGPSPFNNESYTVPESSIDAILIALQTVPFLADTRLIVVKDAHKLKAAELEELTQFLKKPVISGCLVMVWPERLKKDVKTTALVSVCEKNGIVAECRPLYDNELPVWIQKRFQLAGKKVSSEVVQVLIRETGSALNDVTNEIEKLILYAGAAKEITPDDVEQLSGHTRQANLNQLAEAIESRNSLSALIIIEKLIVEGEVPLRILSTIHRVVRRCAIAKSMLEEEGKSPVEIRQELRLHQFFDRYFFNRLGKLSLVELSRALAKIAQADYELKSSNRPESMLFEELMLNLFHSGN